MRNMVIAVTLLALSLVPSFAYDPNDPDHVADQTIKVQVTVVDQALLTFDPSEEDGIDVRLINEEDWSGVQQQLTLTTNSIDGVAIKVSGELLGNWKTLLQDVKLEILANAKTEGWTDNQPIKDSAWPANYVKEDSSSILLTFDDQGMLSEQKILGGITGSVAINNLFAVHLITGKDMPPSYVVPDAAELVFTVVIDCD